MTRQEFKRNLKYHDWYYEYSDDGNVWRRGRDNQSRLDAVHKELECPFGMDVLCNWAHNMVLEEFVEVEPGKFYRYPKKNDYCAPAVRSDLITQAEFDAIEKWMNE